MSGIYPVAPPLDRTEKALGDPYRRYIVSRLVREGTGNIEEFVDQLTAWEAETTVTAAPERVRERVAIALLHNHLPRLADHGIIEYDRRSGDVVLAATDEQLRPVLE